MKNPIKAIENEKCCKKQDWEQMSMDFGGETDNRIYIMYKCTHHRNVTNIRRKKAHVWKYIMCTVFVQKG